MFKLSYKCDFSKLECIKFGCFDPNEASSIDLTPNVTFLAI